MELLIIGGTISFFSFTLLISGIILNKENVNFNKNKKIGKAEVMGYTSDEQSDSYELLVKVLDLNDGKLYNCGPDFSNESKYKKGDIVDVMYAPIKTLGINTVSVYLLEYSNINSERLANILKYISYLLFGISIILVFIGLIRVFF